MKTLKIVSLLLALAGIAFIVAAFNATTTFGVMFGVYIGVGSLGFSFLTLLDSSTSNR